MSPSASTASVNASSCVLDAITVSSAGSARSGG
jgi:hypothetical protein